MIAVTGLNGVSMLLNVDQIIRVEQTPDTLVTMGNGEGLFVRESPDELVDLVLRFKRAAVAGPRVGADHAASAVASHEAR